MKLNFLIGAYLKPFSKNGLKSHLSKINFVPAPVFTTVNPFPVPAFTEVECSTNIYTKCHSCESRNPWI